MQDDAKPNSDNKTTVTDKKQNSPEHDPRPQASLKKKIASAAGINEKTLQRQASNLMTTLLGVSEKELQADPALRIYLRFILFGEDPGDAIVFDKEEPEKKAD